MTWGARFGLWILCLLLTGPLAAQDEVGLAAGVREPVERAITAAMAAQNIPGLSVAVALGGRLRWANGYGLADLENFVPAKAATVYRLGSISKPITAVAALQLAAEGRLDLDAPVQQYVPRFPEKPWPVTTRQLLGHLGGVRHYRGNEIASTRYYPTLLEGLAIFQDDPLLHEPGTKYAYTTYGYSLVGRVVESVAGVPFPDYLRERVFRPAGMDRIRVDEVAAIIPNRAQGYRKSAADELRNSGLADTSYKIPGGGLCATVEDLARFAVAVQEGVLLKPDWVRQMWTSQRTRDGQETGYGLGWNVSQRDGKQVVQHGGGQQRISTLLYLVPESRCAVALMSNLEGARLRPLAEAIADAALATARTFDPERDLISLHYDHAPDQDDGHSAAADRTVLETRFGREWIARHCVAVSGAYGLNRNTFNPESDAVMDAAFAAGGWVSAHRDWKRAVDTLARRWRATLDGGGDVWIKEGGQSDLTVEVVQRLKKELPALDPKARIHLVQHSKWNEDQTTPAALAYAKAELDYIRIPDANRLLNKQGGDPGFVMAATSHPVFGPAWKAAFEYYPPAIRLDFSDTGELFHILGMGELDLAEFQRRFLSNGAAGAGAVIPALAGEGQVPRIVGAAA
jgi:CubicO group peptidase (beta-lactamase class C family)